jgi:hypothetical protein
MVRYEIKMRITSKDYFAMTARYLPFEIVGIEELVDLPMPKAPPPVVALAEKIKKRAVGRKPGSRGHALDLDAGMNKIVVRALRDAPLSQTEIQKWLVEDGYSANSATSQLHKMLKHGVIEHMETGKWRLVNVPKTKETEGIERAANQPDSPRVA